MWKHKESKWLVRGGRKVKCYLCGKKILAKGDLFLSHQDTGYYSHQSCMTESTTISGNERRRAVKKIAVGAAVVGAIAAGAGKLIDISSQSKGSNSPDTQTILTSQGLILPALTSDPANPVAGQMWYRSDSGVTAHFDAVQNRVVYSSEINDGNVNVTSKGIINGLSVLPNDGKGGFGPDTTKGATAPGQYGSPYTQTLGIQEALTYVSQNPITSISSIGKIGSSGVIIERGIYNISSTINYPPQTIPIYGDDAILKWAGTTSEPIMQYEDSDTIINNNYISGLIFDPNKSSSTPASYGLYFKQTATEANNANIYDRLIFREGFTEYGMDISGEATDYIQNCYFGIGESPTAGNAGLKCNSSGSGLYVYHTQFNIPQGINVNVQQLTMNQCILTYIFFNGGSLSITDSYWLGGAATGGIPCIDINGGSLVQISVTKSLLVVADGRPFINASSPISIASLSVRDCEISVQPTSGVTEYYFSKGIYYTVTPSSDNNVMSINLENNWVDLPSGNTLTGPFTLVLNPNTVFNSSNNLYNMIGYGTVTTPAVPASGTAQQNTNPFPTDVYLYGGTVTEIQITKNGTAYTVFSNSSGLALSGQAYRLNPSDSITVTYTAAPTWEWLSD